MNKVFKFLMDINTGDLAKIDAAEFLGISRPTLDKRIKLNNWTKSERALIQSEYNIFKITYQKNFFNSVKLLT